MTHEELQTKLQAFIATEAMIVEKAGSSSFSTSGPGSNFDQDIWNHRHAIYEALQNRGYKVESSISWGVTDVFITKKINLI